jgi:hypothetical protein
MNNDGSKAMVYTDIDVSSEACAARLNLKAANDLLGELLRDGLVDENDSEVVAVLSLRAEAAYALRAIQNRRNGR